MYFPTIKNMAPKSVTRSCPSGAVVSCTSLASATQVQYQVVTMLNRWVSCWSCGFLLLKHHTNIGVNKNTRYSI